MAKILGIATFCRKEISSVHARNEKKTISRAFFRSAKRGLPVHSSSRGCVLQGVHDGLLGVFIRCSCRVLCPNSMFAFALASCFTFGAKFEDVEVMAVGAGVWKLTADDSYSGLTSVSHVKQTVTEESLLAGDKIRKFFAATLLISP